MTNADSDAIRYTIQSITPTMCGIIGIEKPAQCDCEPIVSVIDASRTAFGNCGKAERVLIYAPDAVGDQLKLNNAVEFARIKSISPIEVPMTSVVPPKTPVAFASMFTGASPEVHGITKYERFVLTCDTLFDAVSRAGLKTAIVTVIDSSLDIIFRNRGIDYFTECDDSSVILRTFELIEQDVHSLIVAYNQDYDDALHATDPFSDLAIRAFKTHVKSFEVLHKEADSKWRQYNHVVAFTPDHGAHLDSETGRGDHSIEIPEDMNLSHYFSVTRAHSFA